MYDVDVYICIQYVYRHVHIYGYHMYDTRKCVKMSPNRDGTMIV